MTHVFHPLFGKEFEDAGHKSIWGEEHVYSHDGEGKMARFPARWTSPGPVDLFVELARGRAIATVDDLLRLADLITELGRNSVKVNSPDMSNDKRRKGKDCYSESGECA